MNSKSKKLMNNTILFFIGSVGSKFIQFLLVPLYTYTLTNEDFGVSDIVFTTINFLIPIFSIQVTDGLLRFGLDKKEDKNKVINSTFRILLIGSIFSIIFSPLLMISSTLKSWIPYLIIILNLRIYRDVFSIILKIDDKNKLFAVDSILYTLILCLSSLLLLVVFKIGISGYFFSYIIANSFSIIFIIIVSRMNIRDIKKSKDGSVLKRLLFYSAPLVINSISYWITTASDRYMVNYYSGPADVGLYAIAAKIPTIVTTFTGVFSQAWLISSISEVDNKENSKFYSATLLNYMYISFIFCSLIIAFIKPFMSIYVSNSYYIAWKSSILLILSAVFSGLCSFLNGIYYAYKKNITVTITTIIGAIINIFLNVILINKFGIVGAAIATLISWIIIYILKIVFLKRFINMNTNNRFCFICTFLVLLEIISLYYFSTLISFIINILISFIIIFYCRKFILKILSSLLKKLGRK